MAVSAKDIEMEMFLLVETGTGEKIVEDVVGSLSGWNGAYPAALEAMCKQLSTEKGCVAGGGGIILELE